MPNFGNELHALWELATEREDVKESEDLEEHHSKAVKTKKLWRKNGKREELNNAENDENRQSLRLRERKTVIYHLKKSRLRWFNLGSGFHVLLAHDIEFEDVARVEVSFKYRTNKR
ncbi:hypothetical protein ACROYT_G023773 [Oculina patagonica]